MMISPACRLRALHLFLCVIAWLSVPARAVTVAPAAVLVNDVTAEEVRTSMDMVEGHPAIAWLDFRPQNSSEIRYSRALDAGGMRWGTPVTAARGDGAWRTICLRVIAGRPAVCYFDPARDEVRIVRAADSRGQAWSSPLEVCDDDGAVSQVSMESVGGTVGVVYRESERLVFIRSQDAEGTVWNESSVGLAAVVTPAAVNHGLRVIGGRPSVVFSSAGKVSFIRANDAAGSTWAPAVAVMEGGTDCALVEAGGRPAVCVSHPSAGVRYVRADNADGTAWPGAWVPEITGNGQGLGGVMELVNGKPAIASHAMRTQGMVNFTHATTAAGADGEWNPVRTVDVPGTNRPGLSLLDVNGRPALAYFSTTHRAVKFVRASDADGDAPWPVDLDMRHANNPALTVEDGGTVDTGAVREGQSGSVDLELSNPNLTRAVNILAITIDGAHAPEFSAAARETVIPAGGSTVITVTHTSAAGGMKNAALHITSDADALNPWDVFLTGRTVPEIALFNADGQPVANGSVLPMPVLPAGGTEEMLLTIRNTGGAELRGLAVTMEGSNASEYTVVTPADTLAPGGHAGLTLRHISTGAGQTTATLRITGTSPAAINIPYTIGLLRQAHALDPAFRPLTDGTYLKCTAVGPDGRIYASGNGNMAAFRDDGTPYPLFFSLGIGETTDMVVQRDGKILVAGMFSQAGGRAQKGLARLFPDGRLDETFSPGLNDAVYGVAVQPDGKIIAAGGFTMAGGQAQRCLARFHADSTLDISFAPVFDSGVLSVALLPDGKLLAGGGFKNVNGHPAQGIVRLHPDGTTDTTFTGSAPVVECLAVQPDGRILAGGNFLGGLLRFLPDGAPDPVPPPRFEGAVYKVLFQTDGRFLAGGYFWRVNGEDRQGIARFHADGTLDAAFAPVLPWGAHVSDLAVQSDGKLLVAGSFLSMNGETKRGFARLLNESAFSQLKVSGNNTITWLRTGASEEVDRVYFDVKPDGTAGWEPLGEGSRIPGGWELTGLALPARCTVRVQGVTSGSLFEDTAPYADPSVDPLGAWRIEHFHTFANSGTAADDADPDQDGLTNFTEFAFDLSPMNRSSSTLPVFTLTENGLTVAFTPPAGREAVIYRAAWSPSMAAGTWTTIPNTGTPPARMFHVQATGERLFVRWEISLR